MVASWRLPHQRGARAEAPTSTQTDAVLAPLPNKAEVKCMAKIVLGGCKLKKSQLDRIEKTLARIESVLTTIGGTMSSLEGQLDQLLSDLAAAVAALIAAIPPGVDLTDEIAAVQGILDTVTGATPPTAP